MKKLLALLFCLNIFACDSNTTQNVIVNPVSDIPSENNSTPKVVSSFNILPENRQIYLNGCTTFKIVGTVKYTNGTADSDIVYYSSDPSSVKISNDGTLDILNVHGKVTVIAYPKFDPSKKIKYVLTINGESGLNKDCSKR